MPPITPVTNAGEALLVSLTAALASFMAFVPALLGAVLLLVLGWILAGLLARLVERLLHRAGFDRAAERSGISSFLTRANSTWKTSRIVAEFVRWFVFLVFLQAAASVLGAPQVTAIINSIVLYIPNVVIAVIVLVVGLLLANVVSGLVRGTATEIGLSNPGVLAALTRYAIVGFAVIAAIDQLKVASTVVYTLLVGLVATLAIAFGLAFGLGGRDVAAQITRRWYEDSQEPSRKIAAHIEHTYAPEEAYTQPLTVGELQSGGGARVYETRPGNGNVGSSTRPPGTPSI